MKIRRVKRILAFLMTVLLVFTGVMTYMPETALSKEYSAKGGTGNIIVSVNIGGEVINDNNVDANGNIVTNKTVKNDDDISIEVVWTLPDGELTFPMNETVNLGNNVNVNIQDKSNLKLKIGEEEIGYAEISDGVLTF
ncbi:MAG: hypothetical protein IJ763_10630, partial [Lachnospiraceae bacterium]|nr:hypothetical protein [Lachnospiraceae bacterium]